MVMEIAEFLLAIYLHFQYMYYLRMKYSKHETPSFLFMLENYTVFSVIEFMNPS